MRKALYLMGVLEDTDIEWMAKVGSKSQLRPGAVLIHEGEPIEAMFILLDGHLEVSIGSKPVAKLLAGEVVGEISFVDSLPPSATVVAENAAAVLAIPRDELTLKMERDTAFAARFYKAIAMFLADRLRVTTSRLGYGPVQQEAEPHDPDELDPALMEAISLAAIRFDGLLKRMQMN